MIKITIPTVIPDILQNRGTALTKENCNLYLADTGSYDTGKKKFNFLSEVYGCAEVKNALITAQNAKCCYCESKPLATSYGAVEHFRPKGASIQEKKQNKIYPGYYWLAYDWENLLFICTRCNINKGSYFPLENPTKRAKNHSQSISAEIPLFIHPALDKPLEHLIFHMEAVVGLTDKGEATIKYMELNRQDLFESRLEVFNLLNKFIDFAKKLHNQESNIELYNEAIQHIREYISPSAKYSVMSNICFSQFSNDPEFAIISGTFCA
ncbi:MAG: hypothetical protein WCS87_00120 [Methylococcaceae bacterium]